MKAITLGKAFFTAIGTALAALGASVFVPAPYNAWLIAAGAIIVFAAQTLYDAGLIPAKKR
jgi:FtsH-binding integral membrane protein